MNNRRAHDLPYLALLSVCLRTMSEMAKISTFYCYNVHLGAILFSTEMQRRFLVMLIVCGSMRGMFSLCVLS